MSFIDINLGSSRPTSISEYNGSLYIAAPGSVLYEYSDSGIKEISAWKPIDTLHSQIQWVRVSPDGSRLVYLSTQGIGIYNIKTGESSLVLRHSDDGTTYYIEPTWYPGRNSIIYTKQVIKPGDEHGFDIIESGIYYLDLETSESRKLADGAHGSFVKGRNALVFERDRKIFFKILGDDNAAGKNDFHNTNNTLDENNVHDRNSAFSKNEQIIDEGRFPSVSPCGNYIVYIKFQDNIKSFSEVNAIFDNHDANENNTAVGHNAVTKDDACNEDSPVNNTNIKANIKEGLNAEIHESIENIWITDVSNFENKKQLTTNYPYYFTDETGWLESLEPSGLKQVLLINSMYSYYSPVWSSDSNSIYAIRSKNEEISHESRIIKMNSLPVSRKKNLLSESTCRH